MGFDVEIQALKAFKNSITADPNGALADWVDSHHHCNWSGIACDPSSNHVFSVSLVSLQLQGEISPFLGNISGLQVLDLTSNSFTGYIPAQLSLCTHLSQLSLFGNSLSGPIPPELGHLKSLQYLDLGYNFLNGSLPDSIFNYTYLLGIAFTFNNLTGRIPSNIGNLVNATQILGYGNNLVGSIPLSIGQLGALRALNFSQNKLSGVIPREIGNLTNLEYLLLFQNSLSGKIPSEVAKCSKLLNLELYENQFIGSIPPELGNIVQLETLSSNPAFKCIYWEDPFINNKLDISVNEPESSFGELPSNLGDLHNLKSLILGDNFFHGSIPPSIANCTSLVNVTMSVNALSGKIPEGFSSLSLAMNNFSGLIKSGIQNLSKLIRLQLNVNSFIGSIPPKIGNLNELVTLSLSENKFSGQIPPELSKLSRLQGLSLHENLLEGSIPRYVIACFQDMQIYLNLSYNQLVGNVPTELGMLEMIQAIDISDNNLAGPIPAKAFSHMDLLESLNLSRYHLEGKILGTLAELDRLSSLDLSQNDLKGIPEGFANLSGLVHLNLSFNQLEGPVPKTGIFEHINASSMMGNQDLCGANFLWPCKEAKHSLSKKCISIIAALGSLAILLLLVLVILILNRALTLKRFNPKELEIATGFFSADSIVGTSSLSTVYKGQMEDDGQVVAVLGYAWESGKMKALVQEYMENGNLNRIIHDKGVDQSDGSTLSSLAVLQGTVGYMASEFSYMRKVTTKADVFSFGIIVMEFLTKRRPTGLSEEDGLPITLREVVEKALANGIKQLANIVDPLLTWNVDIEEVSRAH
ncbi:hypothetical protein JHK85_013158 [Glycine max]|nr:hypothetical protein JHK85_013158 [Glycine max]